MTNDTPVVAGASLAPPNPTDTQIHENKLVSVELADLVRDERSQVRTRLDQPTVNRYADAMRVGAEFPPISIAVVDGAPYLIDGWHRVEAAEKAGIRSLDAVLIDAPPRHHAWLAAQANMRNGLPLKRNEARAVFRAYMQADQYRKPGGRIKSSREIAADLNGIRSHVTILNWIGQEFPRIRHQMKQEEFSVPHNFEADDSEHTHSEREDVEAVLYHLDEARKRCRSVTHPVPRAELIAGIEEILEQAKRQGPWQPIAALLGAPEPDIEDF